MKIDGSFNENIIKLQMNSLDEKRNKNVSLPVYPM